MKESRKEFIREAHKNACSEWKQRIEKEFPNLFKDKLDLNKWYKYSSHLLVCVKNNDNKDHHKGYGFDNKEWFDYDEIDNLGSAYGYIPATDKEVETALIKEAKKRGFKAGVNINYLKCTTNKTKGFDGTFKLEGNGNLIDNQNAIIFTDGKWATIIETITKEQAEKELNKKIID